MVLSPEERDWQDQTCERSFGCLSVTNPLRRSCWLCAQSPNFERLVLFFILANAVCMALIDYRNPDSERTTFIENLETVFLIVFSLEMLVKMTAFGIATGETAYLRDPWCWLDFVVVITGLISFSLEAAGQTDNQESAGLSVLRVLRVLRPLRSVSRLPGLRKIIRTFFLSVSRLVNVAAMFLFLIVVFGILGINFLGGVLHRFCRFTPEPLIFYDSTGLGNAGTGLLTWLTSEPHAIDIATQATFPAVLLQTNPFTNTTQLTDAAKTANLID
ncbi:unnamed protein product, partial [Amoebophrya sp. A120]|eukprot:GSA120T00003821001.1